jgi:hypothetical protein
MTTIKPQHLAMAFYIACFAGSIWVFASALAEVVAP